MGFRTPKGVNPRPDRRHRRRRSTHPSNLVRSIERLEDRSLLSGVTWTVTPVNVAATEGIAVAGQEVATITDTSGMLSANDFAATINWGDNTPADTATTVVSGSQPNVFTVLGTHTFAEEGSDTVHVTITHSNSTDPSATVAETATVSDPAVTPSGMTFSTVEAAAAPDQLIATFSDPGGNEFGPSDYSATINWGDTQTSTGTVTFSPTGNDFLVSGGSDHVYNQDGNYNVTVVISHDSAPKATATSTASVSDPSVLAQGGFTYNGLEGGVAFNEPVATFTDPAGPEAIGNYSATVIWGDGATTAGTISLGSNKQFTVSSAHSFVEETNTPLPVSVIINHGASAPVTVSSVSSIADSPLVLTAAPDIAASEGIPLKNVLVATFTDLGAPEVLADYTAAVDWGDGSTSPGSITFAPATGVFSIAGSHLYSIAGRQTIKVTVHHDFAPDATILGNAVVTDPPVKATGNYRFTAAEAALSASQPVATFVDPGGAEALSKYSATINWGDGSTVDAGTVAYNSISGVFTVSGQHLYGEDGSYPITVVANHDVAPSVTVTSTAAVSDPAVVATGLPSGSALEYRQFGPQNVAVFTDPAGSEPVGDYSAKINWGDGTASDGSVAANANGSFSVQGSHLFTRLGPQTVSVTVHHDSAPDVTVQSQVNVNLPPIILTTRPLTWKEWTPLEAPDNALATISFVDNNTRVTIDWGDGVTSAGSVSPFMIGGVGAALGSHTWTETGTYTVTVTVSDGPNSASTSLPVTVLRPQLPVLNPDAATPNEYYVAEVYEDVLRRFVDGGGLMFWSNLLDQGVPRTAVSDALLNSDEYLTNFVIRPAYEKYLGRDADATGIGFWLREMHAGLTDAGLAAALASSPEFYANAGGTNAAFVDALYRVALGRTADGSGEAYWLDQLSAGETAFNVALGFTTSAEDRTTLINQTYFDLLGRNANTAEVNQWLINFESGLASNESLIASVAATDEFYFRAVNE